MQNRRVALALFAVAGMLSACGGNPAHSPDAAGAVRALTGAAPAAETADDQAARAPGIVSRMDSLFMSSVHVETSLPDQSNVSLRSSCSDTSCTLTEPQTGGDLTVSLAEFDQAAGHNQPVGAKHGITLISGDGREDGGDHRSLSAWMENSAFGVYMPGFAIEGERIDARFGMAGGDLTGRPPAVTSTWRGLMVGTPATGAGRGDRLQGDAALTYSTASGMLSAAFTDIKNIDSLRAHTIAAVRFENIPVNAEGEFAEGPAGNRIQGGFYGPPGNVETAGVFEQGNIVGAFGAKSLRP